MIVDAQIHIWKPETADWTWVPGAEPQMPEPFTIERMVAASDAAGVDRVVIVPPSWTGDRNDYALEAVARYPHRCRVMGRVSLQNPRAAGSLATWKDQPGMLGIRLTFLGKQAAWLSDGTADWFWPAAETAGLPVMVLATRIAELGTIAERHPRLPLIIDHMGISTEMVKAGRKSEMVEQTVGLAKYPNVSVKLSGSQAYAAEPYPFADMKPLIRRCFDAFGPRRCHWGSDATNASAKASYRQRVEHFTQELDFLSDDDKDWIMGRSILARLGWA